MMLRSKIDDLKSATERVLAPYCPSGLFTVKFHFLNHLEKDSERFGSISSTNHRQFEQFSVNIRQSHRTKSRRVSTQLRGAVQIMSSTV